MLEQSSISAQPKTIFKSRQVNLDPEPYVAPPTGIRWPDRAFEYFIFDPRPEFEPTRDPQPWECKTGNRHATPCDSGEFSTWAPRREQFDTPVNLILAAFRSQSSAHRVAVLAAFQPGTADFMATGDYATPCTPAEIDHARKVLTRLANITKEGI